MRPVPGNWLLRWLTSQFSPLWQWFAFLCLALAYLAWRGTSPVQLDLLTITVGLLWLVAYAFRWFVGRAGAPPFEQAVVPGGTSATGFMGRWPKEDNPFLGIAGVRLGFTCYSGSYWLPFCQWVTDHSRVSDVRCWAPDHNDNSMAGLQLQRSVHAAEVFSKPPSRLINLPFPTSLRSMCHDSARGRFLMLSWYWFEIAPPSGTSPSGQSQLTERQRDIINGLATSSPADLEKRKEFLRANPLLTFRPLAPHGESNPSLLVRDDGSIDGVPESIVGSRRAGGPRDGRDGSSIRELVLTAQRLASGGLAPFVAGLLLLAPVTGFVPWSPLTGKVLTCGYAVALTYLAASEAARKLAGRKLSAGDRTGLSFSADGSQFHVTALDTAAYGRVADWMATLSVETVGVHSVSAAPLREILKLLPRRSGTALRTTARIMAAGYDRYHWADSPAVDEVLHQLRNALNGGLLAAAEAREMGLPAGLDVVLVSGFDIAGRERVAGVVSFRSCHLEHDEERCAMLADLLPSEPAELERSLAAEGYVVSRKLVMGPPELSVAFFGSADCEYVRGVRKTFEGLWAATVQAPPLMRVGSPGRR